MGRELQKKKNRSSTRKVTQKPKSKKRLLQNPIIAANWDKTQTLSQNYRRLGLTAKLNKITGGVEKTASSARGAQKDGETLQQANTDSLKITGVKRPEQLDVGEVKIERDPNTGRILRVLQDGPTSKANPLNDPLNDVVPDEEDNSDDWARLDNQHGNVPTKHIDSSNMASSNVVTQLEKNAQMPSAKYKRKQTENEIAFIEDLVRKHGDDYGKMARDMKINYMQRSEGDIKRRIKIWKENGGSVD